MLWEHLTTTKEEKNVFNRLRLKQESEEKRRPAEESGRAHSGAMGLAKEKQEKDTEGKTIFFYIDNTMIFATSLSCREIKL